MKPSSESNGKDDRHAGFALALGIGIGTALGVALHNIALGVGLGAAFGVAFAGAIRSRARQK